MLIADIDTKSFASRHSLEKIGERECNIVYKRKKATFRAMNAKSE